MKMICELRTPRSSAVVNVSRFSAGCAGPAPRGPARRWESARAAAARTLAGSLSTQMTSLPFSARQAPATRPTYPFQPPQSSSSRSSCGSKPLRLAQPKKCCQPIDRQGLVAVRAADPRAHVTMPRACASCSIIARRSGSAPASASTCTSWQALMLARLRPSDTLVLFSSSWKDRLDPPRSRRDRRRRARPGPGPELRLASARMAAGGMAAGAGRRGPLRPSAADARRQGLRS